MLIFSYLHYVLEKIHVGITVQYPLHLPTRGYQPQMFCSPRKKRAVGYFMYSRRIQLSEKLVHIWWSFMGPLFWLHVVILLI